MCFEVSRYEGQQTPLTRIADFVNRLMDEYNIKKIALDQYQSIETKQRFEQLGLETCIIQTCRDDSRFIILKNMIYQQSLTLPISDVLRKEMGCVKRDPLSNKILLDHPDFGGHADAVDALCRVVNCIYDDGLSAFNYEGSPRGKSVQIAEVYQDIYDILQKNKYTHIIKRY